MSSIVGVYKIPAVKNVILVMSSFHDFLDSLSLSKENKRGIEHFERILRSKDRKYPRVNLRYTIKLVCVDDFLKTILQYKPKGKVLPNQSSHSPEELGLLTMNILKNNDSNDDKTFHTPKVLSEMTDQDIIEVLIQ